MSKELPTLAGADSATPKPNRVAGKKIWGVYVAGATFHIWSKQEVAGLAQHGIVGVLPIVVPSQTGNWWLTNHGYAELELLVRETKTWGVPKGSPLCLDIEEHQSSQMNAAGEVGHAWAAACRTHDLIPWAYGSRAFLDKDLFNNRWLAEWPNVVPVDPDPPAGYRGWQYHGNDNGIDHDVFLANEIFLSPHLKPVKITAGGTSILPAAEPAGIAPAVHAVGGAGIAASPRPAALSGVGGSDAVNTVSTSTPPPAPTSLTLESSKR